MPIRRAPIHKMTKDALTGQSTGAPGKIPVATRAHSGKVGGTLLNGAFDKRRRVVVERKPPAERTIGHRIDDLSHPRAATATGAGLQHWGDHRTTDEQSRGNKRNEQSKNYRDPQPLRAPFTTPGKCRPIRSSSIPQSMIP